MCKFPRQSYTTEFKQEAIRLVEVEGKPVLPEQIELSRLRAENARLKMELEILEKATAYFAKKSQ